MPVITYREAIRHALAEELEHDSNVIVMGEEVAQYDGAYKVTEGLLAKFGPRRIVDTPISEAGFIGTGLGASLLGVRPETLEHSGAVSKETVTEMVAGALARFGATVAVAVTGIAGPSGGLPDKPVGTVWIGWKRRGGYAQTELYHFAGDREAVRRQAVAHALRLIAAAAQPPGATGR